jgi:hypothetical protein
VKIVRPLTDQDYFDALEILYERIHDSDQCYVLFKVMLKMCNKLERQKRLEFWQHLKWSN